MKKITGLVMTLMMVLATAAYAAEPPVYTDIGEENALSPAVSRLGELDIMTGFPDGTFGADKTFTRAEMAAFIIRFAGLSRAAEGAMSNVFNDVSADYPASGYIALAEQMGVVHGYPDGTFRPDDDVTYEQAIKMIVSVLGYRPKAESIGGYPAGYLMAAAQAGITRGTAGITGSALTRGIAAQLLYNALACPLMEQISFIKDAPAEYSVAVDPDGIPLKTAETAYHLQSSFYFFDKDNHVVLSDNDVVSAAAGSAEDGSPYLDFTLTEKAALKFATATEKIASYSPDGNILKFISSYGLTAQPVVTEKITSGNIRVMGNFTIGLAEGAAASINDNLSK